MPKKKLRENSVASQPSTCQHLNSESDKSESDNATRQKNQQSSKIKWIRVHAAVAPTASPDFRRVRKVRRPLLRHVFRLRWQKLFLDFGKFCCLHVLLLAGGPPPAGGLGFPPPFWPHPPPLTPPPLLTPPPCPPPIVDLSEDREEALASGQWWSATTWGRRDPPWLVGLGVSSNLFEHWPSKFWKKLNLKGAKLSVSVQKIHSAHFWDGHLTPFFVKWAVFVFLNFRLLFIVCVNSFFGNWLQKTANFWLLVFGNPFLAFFGKMWL